MKFLKLVAITVFAAMAAVSSVAASAEALEVVAVHDVPGRTKQEICSSARDWAAVSFKDSNAVIQVFDPERGTMIGKGNMALTGFAGAPFTVGFTLTVECKDGRTRLTWNGFTNMQKGKEYPLIEDSLNNLQTKARAAVGALEAGLLTQLTSAAKSDF